MQIVHHCNITESNFVPSVYHGNHPEIVPIPTIYNFIWLSAQGYFLAPGWGRSKVPGSSHTRNDSQPIMDRKTCLPCPLVGQFWGMFHSVSRRLCSRIEAQLPSVVIHSYILFIVSVSHSTELYLTTSQINYLEPSHYFQSAFG